MNFLREKNNKGEESWRWMADLFQEFIQKFNLLSFGQGSCAYVAHIHPRNNKVLIVDMDYLNGILHHLLPSPPYKRGGAYHPLTHVALREVPKTHQAPLKPKKSKVPWTKEEDAKLLQMWNEDRSWEYIFAALPRRSEGTIQVESSSSGDDDDSSDGDPESSSDDDGCFSEAEQDRLSTSKQSRWSDLDEQLLLAYKEEGKSWEWIFGKFPGKTRPAISTRWNMVRPRVE
ncbi:hypothetical protein ACEPPN_002860 [Leptodophora sp. 'Broadleaf-Isolate-01']